jgi:hypothetical protein
MRSSKPGKAPPDQSAILLRRYNKLREAAQGALRLMRLMEADQALRLPFPGYEAAVEALRKELE